MWFEIRAVSAPATRMAGVLRPYVRWLQRRFAVDAPAAFMERVTKGGDE